MIYSRFVVSLMLTASVPFFCQAAVSRVGKGNLQRRDTGAIDDAAVFGPTTIVSPCSGTDCAAAEVVHQLPCDEVNGTIFAGNDTLWTMLCDTDFFEQDIFPFVLTKTFEECMQYCQNYNAVHGAGKCAGYVFAPDRVNFTNSCYLKSSVNRVVYPSTIHLIAGVLRQTIATSTLVLPIPSITSASWTPGAQSASATIVTPPQIDSQQPNSQESTESRSRPTVTNSTYIGTSVDEVASQYVSHSPARPEQLAADMLLPEVNVGLIDHYPLASDTGSWTENDAGSLPISNMVVVPRISRDGGRGGNVNGTNIFIFCDTSTYGEVNNPIFGYLNGFVSSSIAVDENMNGLNGKVLSLVNSLGQWQDDVGRMRGWVPMTTGEEAFNIAISGRGYRYAVWPNASPIPLNRTHSIMHAPLVFLQVNMEDQSSHSYTSLGNTLLLISVDPVFGPHADRVQNQFFGQNEVGWGSLGGIRAWSSSGQDSSDGSIYVFGQAEGSVLVGKVVAQDYANKSSYEYWNGNSWTKDMPPPDSASDAFMIDQPVMNMDLIYSPAHQTFIMIYLTPQADNTFYYRYLINNDNTTANIIPPYEAGGDDDYVEQILSKTWSDQNVLFTVPPPERGYIYAGGLHAGYFGDDDITNGGMKMLCTWTEHTAIDPNVPQSGYAHKSQIVELGIDDGD